MDKFDEYLKNKINEEKQDLPQCVKDKIHETLLSLPESNKSTVKIKFLKQAVSVAACIVLTFLVILPNISTVYYAKALEKIPVLSKIVKVVTIRNYFYKDEKHEMYIDVPKIEDENITAVDYINKSVDELTKILADRFNEELEDVGKEGHSEIYVDYKVLTNTDEWFTLCIRIYEAAGSSNTYYKYYHIDKVNGKIAQLSDIAKTDKFYTIIEENILNQMKEQMKKDDSVIYWIENEPFGNAFSKIDKNHNFYFNKSGDIVIVFDKYEIAPGSMGTPEFTISKELVLNEMNEEYK